MEFDMIFDSFSPVVRTELHAIPALAARYSFDDTVDSLFKRLCTFHDTSVFHIVVNCQAGGLY